MPPPPTIRFATAGDAPAIHRLIGELALYEREPESVAVTADDLRAQMTEEKPPFECLLAERAEATVGFALFFHTYSTWTGRRSLYLEDLFVLESERGTGTGRALLERLAQIALERDCARLEWAVLDWNEPAIGFYERLGAKPMTEWMVYRLDSEALRRLASTTG